MIFDMTIAKHVKSAAKWGATATCLLTPLALFHSSRQSTQWRSPDTRLTIGLHYGEISIYWAREEYVGHLGSIPGWVSGPYGQGDVPLADCFDLPRLISDTTDYGVSVPLWLLFLCSIAVAAPLWLTADRKRPAHGCIRCKYDLTGNTSGVCPECGTRIAKL